MQLYQGFVGKWSMKAAAVVGGVGLLLLAGIGPVGAVVNGTKHDLVDGGAVTATGTDEICIFCHFPHNTTAAFDAPLWNRAGSALTSWTMYSSPTLNNLPAGTPQGVSLACLGCHDGVGALDVLTIEPAPITTSPTTLGAIANTTADVGRDGDLSNDHPISMALDNVADPGLQDPATVRTTGLLPLYGTGQDRVECASCHNPHNDTAGEQPFLRKANTGSALCSTCHLK